MKRVSHEQVSDNGSGVIRLGEVSVEGDWEFFGVRPIIETTFLDGKTNRRKGIWEYTKYTIWFKETVDTDEFPKVETTTPLMIDDKKIGNDQTWWVIGYLAEGDQVGVELCNRPSG